MLAFWQAAPGGEDIDRILEPEPRPARVTVSPDGAENWAERPAILEMQGGLETIWHRVEEVTQRRQALARFPAAEPQPAQEERGPEADRATPMRRSAEEGVMDRHRPPVEAEPDVQLDQIGARVPHQRERRSRVLG